MEYRFFIFIYFLLFDVCELIDCRSEKKLLRMTTGQQHLTRVHRAMAVCSAKVDS